MSLTKKQLTHNLEAERAVLASCMNNTDAALEAIGLLEPVEFSSTRHQVIFKAISSVARGEGRVVDILSIHDALKSSNDVSQAGGFDYLAELEDLLPTSAALRHHAMLVKREAVRRKLITAGMRLTEQAWEGEPDEVVDQFQSMVFEAALDLANSKGSEILGPEELAQRSFDKATEWLEAPAKGIRTGFHRLDGMINGLKDVNIISASTGVGKTALALNWASNIGIRDKVPCLFINCEMNIEEITPRLLGIISGVPLWRILSGNYDSNQPFQRIANAAEKMRDGALFISDNRSKNINAIMALIRKYRIQQKIQVAIVDYLGEIEPDSQALKDSEYITYGRWVQSLKNCCADIGVKLVLLAQLNREGDTEPSKTKIAGSWKIAQKADTFMILAKDKKSEGKNDLVLHLDKNRNGLAPVTIDIGFEPETQRMAEVMRV